MAHDLGKLRILRGGLITDKQRNSSEFFDTIKRIKTSTRPKLNFSDQRIYDLSSIRVVVLLLSY